MRTRIDRSGGGAVDVGFALVATGLSSFDGRNPAIETGYVVVTAVGIVGAEMDVLIQALTMFALTCGPSATAVPGLRQAATTAALNAGVCRRRRRFSTVCISVHFCISGHYRPGHNRPPVDDFAGRLPCKRSASNFSRSGSNLSRRGRARACIVSLQPENPARVPTPSPAPSFRPFRIRSRQIGIAGHTTAETPITKSRNAENRGAVTPAKRVAHERPRVGSFHDALADGRAFRGLSVVDQLNRWPATLEATQRMSGASAAKR
jgi:hypothetical protein